MPQRVSRKRYAQAVFELALERDDLDQWVGDLEFVAQVLQDSDFSAFLQHADVPIDSKIKAIDEVLREVHPLVRNLVHLLVSRGLVDLVQDLREAYAGLLDEHLGRQRVQVTSAVPLDQRELERISRFVAGLVRKEVVVSTQVDDSLLGGVVIQIGDRLLDGSTRARLDALRNRMHSEVTIAGV